MRYRESQMKKERWTERDGNKDKKQGVREKNRETESHTMRQRKKTETERAG